MCRDEPPCLHIMHACMLNGKQQALITCLQGCEWALAHQVLVGLLRHMGGLPHSQGSVVQVPVVLQVLQPPCHHPLLVHVSRHPAMANVRKIVLHACMAMQAFPKCSEGHTLSDVDSSSLEDESEFGASPLCPHRNCLMDAQSLACIWQVLAGRCQLFEKCHEYQDLWGHEVS